MIVLIVSLLFLISFICIIYKIIRKYNDLSPASLDSGDLIVSNVDLYKYQGLWYEVLRLPNYFEGRDCTNPTAIYTLNNNNTISIKNQCGINNNISIKGTGYPLYPQLPLTNQIGRFKIYFENVPIPGEYNIIYLDSNYQYAMVGTRDRDQLWLLSRSKNIDTTELNKMLYVSKLYGYQTDRLIKSSNEIIYGQVTDKKQ
jgi:apolipoprotein D and lipocalin family protein